MYRVVYTENIFILRLFIHRRWFIAFDGKHLFWRTLVHTHSHTATKRQDREREEKCDDSHTRYLIGLPYLAVEAFQVSYLVHSSGVQQPRRKIPHCRVITTGRKFIPPLCTLLMNFLPWLSSSSFRPSRSQATALRQKQLQFRHRLHKSTHKSAGLVRLIAVMREDGSPIS